jgi:DNA-binding CsgD family transcriptional regulator
VHHRSLHDAEALLTPLTLREEEVLRLMAAGLRNKEIAAQLGISERTATFHVGNVLAKFGADGRVEAIRIARQYGLV